PAASASSTDEFAPAPCTGRASLSLGPRTHETKGSSHPRPESRVQGFFSLLPPARIRGRKVVSETLFSSFQVPLFHQNEIKPLDIGFRPIVAENGSKPPFSWLAQS